MMMTMSSLHPSSETNDSRSIRTTTQQKEEETDKPINPLSLGFSHLQTQRKSLFTRLRNSTDKELLFITREKTKQILSHERKPISLLFHVSVQAPMFCSPRFPRDTDTEPHIHLLTRGCVSVICFSQTNSHIFFSLSLIDNGICNNVVTHTHSLTVLFPPSVMMTDRLSLCVSGGHSVSLTQSLQPLVSLRLRRDE